MDYSKTDKKDSFFSRILGLLLGRNRTPLLRELKNRNKVMRKAGYHFYNFGKSRITPQFASYLYSVYQTVAPLHNFFLANNDPEYYKRQLIAYSLSDTQRKMIQNLSPESIQMAATRISIKSVVENCQRCFSEFRAEYVGGQAVFVNDLYAAVMALRQFCALDYYACLKKFGPLLQENTFDLNVHWIPVAKGYAADFVIDFVNAANVLISYQDWNRVFAFLSSLPQWENFDSERFHQMTAGFSEMYEKKVFETLGCLMTGSLDFMPKIAPEPRDIVRPYEENVYNLFRSTVQDIVRERKLSQFNELLEKVFSYADIKRLKLYTSEESRQYEDRGAIGFAYCNAMMYLKSFFMKYLTKPLDNFVHIFEVVGHCYVENVIPDMVTRYNNLMDLKAELLKFDQHLDPDFSEGYQLKSLLENSRSDDKIIFKLTGCISDLNEQADQILKTSLESIQELRKIFESLLNDRKTGGALVSNWRDVERKVACRADEILEPAAISFHNFELMMKDYKSL